MNNPKISVIVPVYNVEPYLPHCIESIIGQTYGNLEIILVDDGSPDHCGAICDEYAEKDARIKVIHKENGGVSSARNAGLDAATGDYIGFVDADDAPEPDMYAFLIQNLMDYQADVSRCGMVRITGKQREPWGIYETAPVVRNHIENICDVGEAFGILPIHLCNKVYKREVVGDIRFCTSLTYAEDTLFNYQVALNVNSVVCYDQIKYNYTGNPDSVSHKKFNVGKLDEHKVTDIIMEEQKNNVLTYPYCVKGDVLKAYRTIKEIIVDDVGWEYFESTRKRILKHRKTILKSNIYSKITKFKTLLLWVSPKLYQLYVKKTRG